MTGLWLFCLSFSSICVSADWFPAEIFAIGGDSRSRDVSRVRSLLVSANCRTPLQHFSMSTGEETVSALLSVNGVSSEFLDNCKSKPVVSVLSICGVWILTSDGEPVVVSFSTFQLSSGVQWVLAFFDVRSGGSETVRGNKKYDEEDVVQAF